MVSEIRVTQLLTGVYVIMYTSDGFVFACKQKILIGEGRQLVLLRWQEFATRSVAVFFLTCHRGASAGGGGEHW